MAANGTIITYQYPILGGTIGCSPTPGASATWPSLDIAKSTLTWEVANQNVVTNETTFNWSLQVQAYSNEFTSAYTTLVVDEIFLRNTAISYDVVTLFYNGDAKQVEVGKTSTVASGTFTLRHNDEGKLSFPLEIKAHMHLGTYDSDYAIEVTDTIYVPDVARHAVLTAAPNFTDEDSPTITYAVPIGITDVQVCISFTGANDDIAYREVDPTAGSYTFDFTTADKLAFWNLLDQGLTSTSVRFYIKSVLDGETFYEYLTRTVSIINYIPELSPVVVDTNPKTLALTGNENILIKYESTASFNSYAVARKNATIDSQSVKNGETTKYEAAGTIEGPTSNTFYFTVTDNRRHSDKEAVVFSRERGYFIEYLKPTVSVVATGDMSATGEVDVTISGKYFKGTFGAENNTLTITCSISENNEEPVLYTVGTIDPTMTGDEYTHTFRIPGLNYLSVYEVSVQVADKINTASTGTNVVLASTPLFDWGRYDFNFNVPVTLGGGYTYPQRMIWSGAAQLGEGETISLTEGDRISEQPSGIVLVFSLFRDGEAENASIHSFFVSKAEAVTLLPGMPHTFMMGINSNMSVFGSKYVYISNTQIRGFTGNTASGTAACGITFDNTKFVLRYILGV